MSKRVRATVRPHKARSLRPRGGERSLSGSRDRLEASGLGGSVSDNLEQRPARKNALLPAAPDDALDRTQNEFVAALTEGLISDEEAELGAKFRTKGSAKHDVLDDRNSVDDEFDSQFFHPATDSLTPLVDDFSDLDDAPQVETLPPATIARRAKLRRGVGALIAFVGVGSLAIVGRAIVGREASPARDAASETAQPPPDKRETFADARPLSAPAPPPPAAQAEPVGAQGEGATKTEPTPSAKIEDNKNDIKAETIVAKADATPAPSAEPVAASDAALLKKQALDLLNRGKFAAAVPVAQAAVQADPADAMTYLYLGAALQDSGKWADAKKAYSDCVHNATRGSVAECRALGGR